jgi:hypothetical protein
VYNVGAEVAFFRRPDNRPENEEYGLAPKTYWGYKNWLAWEEHLYKVKESGGKNGEKAEGKLLSHKDCFKWCVGVVAVTLHDTDDCMGSGFGQFSTAVPTLNGTINPRLCPRICGVTFWICQFCKGF